MSSLESCKEPQQGSPSFSELHFVTGPDTPYPWPILGSAELGTTPTQTLTPFHPILTAVFPAPSVNWGWLVYCQPWSLLSAWPSSPYWGLWEGTGWRWRAPHFPSRPMALSSPLQSHMFSGAGREIQKTVLCCSPE